MTKKVNQLEGSYLMSTGKCELCGLSSPCLSCLGSKPVSCHAPTSVAVYVGHSTTTTTTTVHVVSGTAQQVASEWDRLAKEDNEPS